MEANDANVFTEHVKTLSRDTFAIPSAVRKKLASRLRRLLKTRGLLNCPASTFGYSGKHLGDKEPFEDLLNDAYIHVFYGVGASAGEQLLYLKRQVHVQEANIDALIQRNLSHYVHDLHRNAFPSGAGIHKNVVAASKKLHNDEANSVRFLGEHRQEVQSNSVLGLPSSGKEFVDASTLERSIRAIGVWDEVLKIVQRFSKAATDGTANGTLALIESGKHPIQLSILENAIAKLAYEPASTAPMVVAVDFGEEESGVPDLSG